MSEIITKELLETSIAEHKDFMTMVCKNKYGHENIEDVIEGVINYCKIEDEAQKELLRSGKFIPAGSILSACNSGKENASFSNCYLTKIEEDSMDGIFECQKNLANTFKFRGGSGFDITILRPKDSLVNNAANTSSGAVSFMPSFSEVGRVVGTNGRRAAMICTIDIRHPDALDFIWCKADPSRVFQKDVFTDVLPDISSMNISLKLTDSFMKAVEEDDNWAFCFPDFLNQRDLYKRLWDGDYDKWFKEGGKFKTYHSMNAREVLAQLSEAAYICGDPGVMFIDTVQKNTFGTYIHESLVPQSSNPCGEQMLSYWNNCLLGSFVLTKYFIDEFDWSSFQVDIGTATELMNLFSNINQDKHPLEQQREADKFGKRIGIEFTGLGDILALQGYDYGDKKSQEFCYLLTKNLIEESLLKSTDIAEKVGCCDALYTQDSRQNLIDHLFLEIPDFIKERIRKYGLANCALLTVGPTGTLSIISGNVTSGIEPLFRFSYKRKNRIDGREYSFIHLPAAEHMLENLEEFNGLTLTEAKEKLCYLEADGIPWKDRINVQAALQKNIDASISSTINLPSNTTKETIQEIYKYAWDKGLKGVTVFRDGCKEGVLSSTEDFKVVEDILLPEIFEKELLDEETAVRHRVSWKGSKLYINVSLDGNGIPIEVFAKLPKQAGMNGDGTFNPVLWQERTSNWDLICRSISMNLRFNIPIEEIIEQLDKSTYSMVDAAGILRRVLSKYIQEENIGNECPECKKKTYVLEGGCGKCVECGYSECG